MDKNQKILIKSIRIPVEITGILIDLIGILSFEFCPFSTKHLHFS